MGRVRMLPPEFFTDEVLASLSPAHRWAFAGLFCESDREGRTRDQPRRLQLGTMPWDEVDFDAMLDDLARAGLIVRYERDNEHFIVIPQFLTKWRQKPHIREADSDLPPPPRSLFRNGTAPGVPSESEVAGSDAKHKGRSGLAADPSDLVSDHGTQDRPSEVHGAKASQGTPKASLGGAHDQKLNEAGSTDGDHERSSSKDRLRQAKDQPRRPDPESDPKSDPDPDSRSALTDWPKDLLEAVQKACRKTDVDQDWQAFVGKTLRSPKEKRDAGARAFLAGGYAQSKNDPLSYCAAMIERSTGKPPEVSNGNGHRKHDSGARVVPSAAETTALMAAQAAKPKASPEAVQAAKDKLPSFIRKAMRK